jgi:DNA adenine methylase
MEPFLRWAGGKRWLTPKLSPILKRFLSESSGVYAEPFLGSGAMFFGLAPQKAILSDSNRHLINAYRKVASHYREIESLLRRWPVSSEFYYELRSSKPRSTIERAAQFIYLNRTCYGGLYRENRNGEFNTPYGGGSRTPEPILRKRLLEKARFALQNVTIDTSDFEHIVSSAGDGDLVYCDPTYSNVTRGAFDRYGSTIFDWGDQIRLALAAQEAMDCGATVLVSNGWFEDLHELYPAAYRIKLERKKTIGNRASEDRRHVEYLLILDPYSRRSAWETVGAIENRKSKKRYVRVARRTKTVGSNQQSEAA